MRQYRHDSKIYETKSLMLREHTVSEMQSRINELPGYTMSRFIEETVHDYLVNNSVDSDIIMVKRNAGEGKFIKKTFTFTKEFISEISSGHNMSGLVDFVLSEVFQSKK